MVAFVEQFAPKPGAVEPQNRAPDFFGRPDARAPDPVTQVLDRAGESSAAATIARRGAALAQGGEGLVGQVINKIDSYLRENPVIGVQYGVGGTIGAGAGNNVLFASSNVGIGFRIDTETLRRQGIIGALLEGQIFIKGDASRMTGGQGVAAIFGQGFGISSSKELPDELILVVSEFERFETGATAPIKPFPTGSIAVDIGDGSLGVGSGIKGRVNQGGALYTAGTLGRGDIARSKEIAISIRTLLGRRKGD